MSEEAQQVVKDEPEEETIKTEEGVETPEQAVETPEQAVETPEQAVVKEEEPESEDEEIEYECPPEFDDREEMRKMFVGGLDKDTADDEFKTLFGTFGEVTDFIIIRKDNSKSDRLFGFITFAKCDDLEECLLARPHKYKEKDLDVKRAVPRGQEENNGHFKVKKLHVANVPVDFTNKELKRYLLARHPTKYGVIEEINLLKTKDEQGNPTDKNRGFGFVTVSTEDFADRIAIGESKFTLNGQSMRISKAKPRNNEGGGGRGGFKGGRNQSGGPYGGGQGGWGEQDWGGYQGGYGNYGGGYGYGYAPYGGGYDYYAGGYGGGQYGGQYGGPARTGRGGGGRFQPY